MQISNLVRTTRFWNKLGLFSFCGRRVSGINWGYFHSISNRCFYCVYIDIISAASYNMKFMCMRLKNWDKGEDHRAFPFLLCRIRININILRY